MLDEHIAAVRAVGPPQRNGDRTPSVAGAGFLANADVILTVQAKRCEHVTPWCG